MTRDDDHPDLFAPKPPFSRPGTSEEAAETMRDSAATIRAKILKLTMQRGLQGVTRTEAEEVFGLEPQTVSARLWELETLSTKPSALRCREVQPREMFVVDHDIHTGRVTRPSPHSGRNQLVYFAFRAVTVEQVLAHYGLARL